MPSLLNSSDFLSYGSNSQKRYTLRLLLMCLEEERVLQFFLSGRGANDLPWRRKCLPGGLGLGGNYTD